MEKISNVYIAWAASYMRGKEQGKDDVKRWVNKEGNNKRRNKQYRENYERSRHGNKRGSAVCKDVWNSAKGTAPAKPKGEPLSR